MKTYPRPLAGLALLLFLFAFTPGLARAADHADGPSAANNASADLADVFFFLDPNDNSRAVLEMTMRGFIVPGEAANMGIFDPELTYQFGLEETGDAAPDALITINFSPRASASIGQIATVRMTRGSSTVFEFSAPATVPNLSPTAPTQVVSTDSASGVKFFAGEVDDPFFFDIPGFSRFVSSVLAGSPNVTALDRGRDTFAGYNISSIALSIPKTLLNSANNVVGAEALIFRADRFPVTLFGNMSTRGKVGVGDDVLIGGIIISGNSLKRIVIRALGPSLATTGVVGALLNPTVTVFNSQMEVVASNDDWQTSPNAGDLTAVHLDPTDPRESALIATLAPGNYTAVVSGVNGTSGIGLVEAYDLDTGAAAATGTLRQLDRMGNPAVNVALVPFARKDEYNTATPQQDAAGRFAGDIVATLTALGTNSTNIGILASVAVTHGDYLHLNLQTANSGPGGGTNSEAAFPNGRRLGDDTVDTLLNIITNGAITAGDHVNANDVSLQDAFPFFALSQQPRDPGVIDDNTRN